MKLKESGLGCFILALIPIIFILAIAFEKYTDHIENLECIKIGGIMKQTNSAFQAYQRNCIK